MAKCKHSVDRARAYAFKVPCVTFYPKTNFNKFLVPEEAEFLGGLSIKQAYLDSFQESGLLRHRPSNVPRPPPELIAHKDLPGGSCHIKIKSR